MSPRDSETARQRTLRDGKPAWRPLTACQPAAPGTAIQRPATPPPPQRLHRQRLKVHAAMDAAGQPTRQRATRVRQPAVTTACGFTAHSPPTASPPAVPSPRGNKRRPTTSQPAFNQRRDRPRRKDSRRKDPAAVTANQRPNQRPSDQPTRPPPTASPPAVPSWRAPGTSADHVDAIGEKGEEGQHADDRRGEGYQTRGWP